MFHTPKIHPFGDEYKRPALSVDAAVPPAAGEYPRFHREMPVDKGRPFLVWLMPSEDTAT
jgi:hypothetical protein